MSMELMIIVSDLLMLRGRQDESCAAILQYSFSRTVGLPSDYG